MRFPWISLRIMLPTLTLGLGTLLSLAPTAQADPLLEETGTIYPAEESYTFEGTAGQNLTIELLSEEFDPVLSLTSSTGEELAVNDDFGGSLNSTIIIELPDDDTYTVTARSFTGLGGDYALTVRDSTPYEIAFNAAQTLAVQEQFSAAIEGYSEAIELDPDQAAAYLGRAEAYLGQVYLEQGEQIQSPADIPEATRDRIITDFESAADLIEATGNVDWAASLREQAQFLRNAEPEVESSNGGAVETPDDAEGL